VANFWRGFWAIPLKGEAEHSIRCPAWAVGSIAVISAKCSSTKVPCHIQHRTSRTDRRSVRDSNRRHAAHLPRPKGLRDGGCAAHQESKNPHSMVEVRDLKSGDVTAVAN